MDILQLIRQLKLGVLATENMNDCRIVFLLIICYPTVYFFFLSLIETNQIKYL